MGSDWTVGKRHLHMGFTELNLSQLELQIMVVFAYFIFSNIPSWWAQVHNLLDHGSKGPTVFQTGDFCLFEGLFEEKHALA